MLSYFKILPPSFLRKNKHNLVVHESNLPKGKGWSPLTWQILEGSNEIPIVLFEATKDVDSGDIYLKDVIKLNGYELIDEIREKQATKTKELVLKFLELYPNVLPLKQKGKETFYRRRTPEDSKLKIDKSLKEQFSLLRVVDNDKYPAFFVYKGHTYVLKIYRKD